MNEKNISCSAIRKSDELNGAVPTPQEAAVALEKAKERYNSSIIYSGGNRWLYLGDDIPFKLANGARYDAVPPETIAKAKQSGHPILVDADLEVVEYNEDQTRGVFTVGHRTERSVNLRHDPIQRAQALARVINKAADEIDSEVEQRNKNIDDILTGKLPGGTAAIEQEQKLKADNARDIGWVRVKQGILAINKGICSGNAPAAAAGEEDAKAALGSMLGGSRGGYNR